MKKQFGEDFDDTDIQNEIYDNCYQIAKIVGAIESDCDHFADDVVEAYIEKRDQLSRLNQEFEDDSDSPKICVLDYELYCKTIRDGILARALLFAVEQHRQGKIRKGLDE